MIGGEMHRFRLNDSYYSEGANYNEILVTYGKGENDKNMIPGKESASDAFVQLKHQWKNFTLNAGIRYDYKKRNQDETKYILIDDIKVEQKISAKIQEWSPRVALIYVRPKWSAKVSYSKSFVDAPYFYRNNNLDTSYGFNLESEYLHSWQFTLTGNRLVKGLNIELTGFYNKATNLVHRDGMFYYNSGSMKSNGLELIADYRQKHFSVMANLTSQYLIDAEDYRTSGNTIYNIPKLTANGIVTYKPIDNLRISATANYTSKQITTMELPDPNTWDPIYTEIDVPARVICGLNASYAFNSIIELGVKAHNIFAKKYEQGGTSIGPIRQQGFWMLGELTIKL
jgi:iron complex outermembrane receptor protein